MFDKFKYSKRKRKVDKLLVQGLCPFCKKELNFYLTKDVCICSNCGILPNIENRMSLKLKNHETFFWKTYLERGIKHKGQ